MINITFTDLKLIHTSKTTKIYEINCKEKQLKIIYYVTQECNYCNIFLKNLLISHQTKVIDYNDACEKTKQVFNELYDIVVN